MPAITAAEHTAGRLSLKEHMRTITYQYAQQIYNTLDGTTLYTGLEAWLTDFDAYVTRLAGEYPANHRDLTAHRQALKTLNSMFKYQYNGSVGVSAIIGQFSRPFAAIARIPVLIPPPLGGYVRQWTSTGDYIHVKGGLGLNDATLKELIAALTDGSKRHQSSRVVGAPRNMQWYSHEYGPNLLYAVGAWSGATRSVEVLAQGKVNAGTHRF